MKRVSDVMRSKDILAFSRGLDGVASFVINQAYSDHDSQTDTASSPGWRMRRAQCYFSQRPLCGCVEQSIDGVCVSG